MNDIIIDGINCKGCNGYVFFGEHKIMKKRVALKFYYYVNDLHPEVEILASLRHKNIISILDARSVGNGWAFFMTPEIKMGDLDNQIERKLGIKKSLNFTRDILEGLTILHNAPYRLVHRDLKPSNVLVDLNENVLIGDFGSIKKIDEGKISTNASRHTVLYKPIEAFNDQYFFSSDIYQVGVILFQLLGGNFPYSINEWLNSSELKKLSSIVDSFESSTFINEVFKRKINSNKLIDLNTLPLFIPIGIKKIIKKATSSNLKIRYQNTAEIMLALHNYGEIPDWKEENDIFSLENWHGKDYRIVTKGINYVCEFKKSSGTSWRRKSDIAPSTIGEVIQRTNSVCGIA